MPVSTPNYLSTDASGRVVAMFSGGIILPTPSTGIYDSGSSITWTDGPGGARIADIRTVSIGNPGQTANGEMVLETFSEGHSRSEIDLTANGHGASFGAQFIVGSATDADPTNSTITAIAGGATRTILGKGGTSDFVQFGSGSNKARVWGPYFVQAVGLAAGAGSDQVVSNVHIPVGAIDLMAFGSLDPEGYGSWRLGTHTPVSGFYENITIGILNNTAVGQNIGVFFCLVNW